MERSHVSERILALTLEIIRLLTGECVTVVHSGDLVAIKAPSHYFVIPEEIDKRKILEVTKQIMELLCQGDGAVGFFMEDQVYLDEEKDLHEAAIMEDQPTEESRKCSRPLHCQDSAQEEVPSHQGDTLLNSIKLEEPDGEEEQELHHKCARPCKEEPLTEAELSIKNEKDDIGGPSGVHPASPPDMEEKNFTWAQIRKHKTTRTSDSEEHFPEKPLPSSSSMRSCKKSSKKGVTGHPGTLLNPERKFVVKMPTFPHRSADQLQESSQKGLTGHLATQSAYSSSDSSNPERNIVVKTVRTSNSKESITTVPNIPHRSFIEANDSSQRELAHHVEPQSSPSTIVYPGPHSTSDQSKDSEGATDHSDDNRLYSCCLCGKTFMLQLLFGGRSRTAREPFTCCECQNQATPNSARSEQLEDNEVVAKYYTCLQCPKTFSRKNQLVHHQRIHREDSSHSCIECGKCFSHKSYLTIHQRNHTGERPFPCSKCGMTFTSRSSMVRHLKVHIQSQTFKNI